ncbi:hypothetical protein SAMN04488063_3158 [Halopelagius inordinatus]|uniref:Uncharacterized protein n=1 Tax=Halopelagius inordinatus TaxID=553467 RepID=A0A1I2VCQ7_9EURY|nr:hypothetical protein [Halopelagius inordinatus]SFG86873.1 hypothetical protein SAMN04488063_3158 [Halopelagius inordinatus]
MADTKSGREKQADNEERRQREREITEARTRADEAEPPEETEDATDDTRRESDDGPGSSRRCHRRGCDEPATFEVLERYQEETGHGAVEATAALCREHADEESPTNLDLAYDEYVFRVTPLSSMSETDTA